MKNIYFKIITSAIIAACLALSTCGFEESDDYGMVWIAPTGPDGFWMGSSLVPTDPNYDKDSNNDERVPANDPTGISHKVTLTKGFYMGRFPITQRQYYSVMGTNPSVFAVDLAIGGNIPVECVSWYDAIVFCNRLSIREGLAPVYRMTNGFANNSTDPDVWIESSPGKIIPDEDGGHNANWDEVEMIGWPDKVPNGYRLPTEAEWEYACRAGTKTAYNTGDAISPSQANYNDSGIGGTTQVGSYVPNAWGLYDMYGNVSEWCWDWYGDYPGNEKNPEGVPSGFERVHRGGSYQHGADGMRSAFRNRYDQNCRGESLGFRVIRQ